MVGIDTVLERYFPGLALRRMKARIWLEQAKRVYDAAKGSSYRVGPTDRRSADAVMEHAGTRMRQWARHLDENHDLSIGVLDVLVNNVVGTGIAIEPMVRDNAGDPAEAVNAGIRRLLKEWAARPEVTGELPFGEAQRLLCRAWLRDGEALVQHVLGSRFRHYSEVPYSIELVEADLMPFEPVTGRADVIHGVQKNAWGQPLGYWLYKKHPGNAALGRPLSLSPRDLRRVPAENMIHLKFTRRFRQTRGVSIFHGVITRLADLKDYEESERIAARVAASLTAFIKKGTDFSGEAAAATGDRSFEMKAGYIFDNLREGEDVGTIKSERPNPGLGDFVKANQRGLAAGTGTAYSAVAKDYDGTYSAQRQEMVEQQAAYGKLQDYFIAIFVRRIYREFLTAAVAAGLVDIRRGVDPATLFDADMRPPGMPWIDPKKEAEADILGINARLTSRTQVIRKRGGDPDVVEQQIIEERERDRKNGFGPPAGAAGQPGAGDGAGDGGDGADDAGDDGDQDAAAGDDSEAA